MDKNLSFKKRYFLIFSVFLIFAGGWGFFSSFGKGEKLFRKGEYEKAEKKFLESVKEGKEVYRSWVYLGRIYAIKGEVKKAIQILEKARDSFPKSPDAYYFLAIVYQLDMRYHDAEKAINKLSNMPGLYRGFVVAPIQPPVGAFAGQPLKPGKKKLYLDILKGKVKD